MVYVIFGVSTSGKTTIGKKISIKLGIPFYDADDFHSDDNIEKMKSGIPLDDHDRSEWLQSILLKINESNKNKGSIFACSALKEKYRKILSNSYKSDVKFIFLKIDKTEAKKRIKMRKDHFFPLKLLNNQFQILEESSDAIEINAENDIELVCDDLLEKIRN